MTPLEDEEEDSRTSGVGRKRNLGELTMQEDTNFLAEEQSPQRSHKRTRQILEPAAHVAIEDGMALGATASAVEQPSSSTESVIHPSSEAIQPTSWNKRVQGGLRTSFGSKRDKAKAAVVVMVESLDVVEAEPPRPFDHDDRVDFVDAADVVLQQDRLIMAKTSDPFFVGVEGNALHAQGPYSKETPNASKGYSETGSVIDILDSEMDDEPGLEPFDGTVPDELLDEDEDEPDRDNRMLQNLADRNYDADEHEDGTKENTQTITKPGDRRAYPKQVPRGKQVYKSEAQTYNLLELRKEGEQIKLEDFKFQDFIHHFVKTNPTTYQFLRVKNFKGAYNTYLSTYYNNTQEQLIRTQDANTELWVQAAARNMIAGTTTAPLQAPDIEYPRDLSGLQNIKRRYQAGKVNFELIEFLKNGNQVNLMDLTFEDFTRHLMRTNPSTYHLLTPKAVTRAFTAYMKLYYVHPDNLKTRERKSNLFKKQRYKMVTQAVQDTKRLLTSELDEPPINSSPIALITRATNVDRDQEGAALENPKMVDVEGSRVPQSWQRVSSSNTVPSFAPTNESRPYVPIQAATESLSTPNIPSPAERGPAAGNSEVFEVESDFLSDLVETGASSTESDTHMDVDIDQVETELLSKYFPAVNGQIIRLRCLACGDSDHRTFECPSLSCSSCGDGGNHSDLTCPLNQRCGKCRKKGHSMEDCHEKLFASNAEVGECDLCKSSKHIENDCHYVWRSFAPKPEETRTVSGIPIHCYTCGSTGHYGPECGLHRGIIRSGGMTWSLSNLGKYLDGNSKDRAISSGVDYTIPKNTGKMFAIKGKANDPIMLDDSDDDVSFLHSRVNKASAKAHHGQIRFGQNSKSAGSGDSFGNTQLGQRYAAPAPSRKLDSARYGRERAFSPPPSYDNYDQEFLNNDRYHSLGPVKPYRQNNYHPPSSNIQGPPQSFTFLPARNSPTAASRGRAGRSRGGRSGRGGGGGGASTTNAPPVESKKQRKKHLTGGGFGGKAAR